MRAGASAQWSDNFDSYANGTLLANLNVPAPLAGTTYGFVVIPGPNGGEGIFDSLTVRTLPR